MKTYEKLTETLEEAQVLLRKLIQTGNGRLDELGKQLDVLQDVATHVEYELAQDRTTKTNKQSRKAVKE